MLSHSANSYGYNADGNKLTAVTFDQSPSIAFIDSVEFDDDLDQPALPFAPIGANIPFITKLVVSSPCHYISTSVYRLSIRAPPLLINS